MNKINSLFNNVNFESRFKKDKVQNQENRAQGSSKFEHFFDGGRHDHESIQKVRNSFRIDMELLQSGAKLRREAALLQGRGGTSRVVPCR